MNVTITPFEPLFTWAWPRAGSQSAAQRRGVKWVKCWQQTRAPTCNPVGEPAKEPAKVWTSNRGQDKLRIQDRTLMRLLSKNRIRAGLSGRWAGAVLGAAALAAFWGCATRQQDATAPQAREDLAEYRQVAVDAQKVVKVALRSLDRAVAEAPCPPRVYKAFTKDVQRLEVDSFKIRARAQAIRARGEAYFAQWQEHLEKVNDPAARKLAEQRRDLLKERFARIRLITQQTREAFQPFMSGLHRLRNGLENDPGFAGADSSKALIQTTRDNGRKVEDGLASVLEEMKAVAAILKKT